ncbi:hypothetical protein [Nocardioides sp. TF02-7]|uniref:hypothetical protein n=1 Tax=Nocardioides sp. TF02-7 TaxID=2917724 RepID=UPI001F06DEC9|nr:hypothetical protein [Nocardioides sp. TF02-7]UMG93158.1 hypothetical protein MF408_02260 [Nocardioides sp. TF02-7]
MAGVRLTGSAGGTGEVSFRILDRAGDPVTAYVLEQTKPLHLYVVRTDLAEFRHLHPVLSRDGTWSAPVDLTQPGDYRVLAEFVPEEGDGRPVALGVDRTLPGRWRPATVPAGTQGASGDDGTVEVAVDGTGEVGPDGRLALTVRRVGAEGAVSLGSYLGTYAHLTGFPTDGSAGYVHVHPYGEPEQTEDGTRLTFHTTFDEPGEFRFFVQVRLDGFVHTVPVTAAVR